VNKDFHNLHNMFFRLAYFFAATEQLYW